MWKSETDYSPSSIVNEKKWFRDFLLTFEHFAYFQFDIIQSDAKCPGSHALVVWVPIWCNYTLAAIFSHLPVILCQLLFKHYGMNTSLNIWSTYLYLSILWVLKYEVYYVERKMYQNQKFGNMRHPNAEGFFEGHLK